MGLLSVELDIYLQALIYKYHNYSGVDPLASPRLPQHVMCESPRESYHS